VTLATLVGTGPPAAAFYHNACDRTDAEPGAFADAGIAADCLKVYGISLGKGDGTFGENDKLLRSQVASFLARLLSLEVVSLANRRSFSDVNANTVPNSQVRDEIELLAGAGIIAGSPDGLFHPGSNMTVAQAATFMVRTLQLVHSQRPNMPDFRDQGTTSANYNYALGQGILDPSAENKDTAQYQSEPTQTTVRGLLADMIAQSLQKLGKWYYLNCAEAQQAGVTPIHRPDPGYRPGLDPDGDGTAC
jgi:hypothetical protein